MTPLSAVLVVFNEEADVGAALDAIGFADEILVVDSGSTDRTVEECRSRGARVLHRPFDGFGPQKRWAVDQALHDWVLCIDADEVVTHELRASIQTLLSGTPPRPAYGFVFRTIFMGRPLLRGAIGRKAHVRLFDRRRAQWTEARLHEKVVTEGPTGRLDGVILHHTSRDLSESLSKLDRYTSVGAEEVVRRGRTKSALAIVLSGAYHFFRLWLVQGQVLNGLPGFAWSLLHSLSPMVKQLKAHEMEHHR